MLELGQPRGGRHTLGLTTSVRTWPTMGHPSGPRFVRPRRQDAVVTAGIVDTECTPTSWPWPGVSPACSSQDAGSRSRGTSCRSWSRRPASPLQKASLRRKSGEPSPHEKRSPARRRSQATKTSDGAWRFPKRNQHPREGPIRCNYKPCRQTKSQTARRNEVASKIRRIEPSEGCSTVGL